MDPGTLRRWWPLAAVAALFALTGLAAAHSSPRLERTTSPVQQVRDLPDLDEQVEERAPVSEPPATGTPAVPDWVATAVAGVLLALLCVVVLMVVWRVVGDQVRRRERPTVAGRAGPAPVATADVVAALDAGLADLSDTDRDPRRAVIACWVRLEEAAAAAGTPRRPDDTATDLVARLLREQRVDPALLAGFAGVYRAARYGSGTVDEQMRAEAQAALRRLRADLTTAVAR